MARTYAYALTGALLATFTITPVLASLLLPKQVKEVETFVVHGLHFIYHPAFALRGQPHDNGRHRAHSSCGRRLLWISAGHGIPAVTG